MKELRQLKAIFHFQLKAFKQINFIYMFNEENPYHQDHSDSYPASAHPLMRIDYQTRKVNWKRGKIRFKVVGHNIWLKNKHGGMNFNQTKTGWKLYGHARGHAHRHARMQAGIACMRAYMHA